MVLMAATLKSQLSVAVTALGVSVIVVYLLLPLRSSVTPVAKPFIQQRRHIQALEGPALAKAGVRSGSSANSYYNSSMANSSNSVKRFHWPSEASSKAHGRRAICKYCYK